MKSVLERVHDLIALAESPNENEARNAAVLAVGLIRKHRIVLTMPARRSSAAMRAAAPASEPKAPASRRRSTGRGKKRSVDLPDKIVAPLGGECIECGGRYRADQPIFWFRSGGGMHVGCFEAWAKANGL